MTNKSEKAYKTIGEVSKMVNLTSGVSKKSNNHTLRYWETQFKQIKPKIFAGKRRYYDKSSILILKKIHFLLKERGMTINGVKKLLNNKPLKLDEVLNNSISGDNLKTLPVGLAGIVGQYQIDWGFLLSGAVLASLPVIILFICYLLIRTY